MVKYIVASKQGVHRGTFKSKKSAIKYIRWMASKGSSVHIAKVIHKKRK